MIKYILKRIGLAVIILLGVSLIIYFLVRLMPNDYLETKFSSKLQDGSMKQEDLDEYRKKYGLYMPDAFIDLELNVAHDSVNATEFRADTKTRKYEDLCDKLISYEAFYAATYSCDVENVYLELTCEEKDGREVASYRFVDKSDEANYITLATGIYTAGENGVTLRDGKDSTKEYIGNSTYKVATFWNKFGAIFKGYFSWLGNMLRGDMGESFSHHEKVTTVIAKNMWISFAISLVALVLQFAISIPMGITSATHQYSVRDYTVTVITMIGISLPSFFFAALLIKIFSSWLGWFPASGLVSGGSSGEGIANLLDMLHHLILPMTVLVVLSIGGLMRYTRTNMLEVLNSDYIRTARSKGLSEKKVIYVHAFRNTMIPLMTLLAGILPSLFGGAMITEEVFSIDGIGRLAYKALQAGDIPFIMGYNMFLAVLTVIGTLLSDIMYAVVDPRVKLTK